MQEDILLNLSTRFHLYRMIDDCLTIVRSCYCLWRSYLIVEYLCLHTVLHLF